MIITYFDTHKAFIKLSRGEFYPEFIFVRTDRNRRYFYKNCGTCETDFYVRPTKKSNVYYCSQECQYLNKRFQTECAYCHTPLVIAASREKLSDSGLHFCSRECKDISQRIENGIIKPSNYGDGKSRYRIIAMRVYGAICNRCEYNENKAMLDVHHADGDRKNNKIENLEVLCVWCHALETRKDWKDFGE